MKRKKILLSIPLLGLLLGSCEVPEVLQTAWDKTKDFVNEKIVDPIKEIVDEDSGEKEDNQGENEGGNQDVTVVSVTEILGLPQSIEQGETLGVEGITAKVLKSDQTTETVAVTKIELDTSKVGDSIVGKAYVGDLFKEFTIKVTAKEVPPVGEAITPQQAIALMEEAGEGVVVAGLKQVKGICAQNSTYDSKYKQYTTGFDGVSNFKLQFTDTKNILNGALPDGMEIVVEGYLEKFQGKYQLSYLPDTASPTGEKFTPNLVSAKAVEHDAALVSISVSETHREFYQGSTFVGETVTAHYSDGSTAPVVATFSGYNMDTLGVQTVNVSYTEKDVTKETSYTITIIEKTAVNYGTEENPLSVTQALVIINNECLNSDDMTEQAITFEGEILEIKNTFHYDSGPCFELNVTDGTNSVYVYRCHSTEEQEPNVKVGATVKIVGFAKNYKGTLEFVDNGETKCHFLYVSGGEPVVEKEIVSIEIVGDLAKKTYNEGEAYSTNGLSVKAVYGDQSEGTITCAITLDKQTATLGDTELTASASYNEINAAPVTFTVTVNEKVPAVGSAVYTFTNGDTKALNVSGWSKEQFMEHVNVDGASVITGMKDATNAYIGGNGGSGTSAWELWDCLKVGKSAKDGADGKGEITLLLDSTANFSKIKVSAIGARDDGTLTINSLTKDVNKKAVKDNLEPIELEYEIAGGVTELKLSSKSATSNNYGICITRIEFVVEKVELSSLELTTAPSKVNYYAGESFDAAGMVVTAKYTGGGQDKVLGAEEYTVDKTILSLEDTFVTVSYTEDEITKTVDVPVTVTKEPVPVTGISLDKTEVSMKVNEEDITLSATVAPEDADDPTVVWSVSEEGVVTVNNGVVHAVAAGEVTVTATAGDFHADCVVTVAPADKVLSGIEVTTQPSKRSYVAGEIFDPTGMVVTASYSSGHASEEVTGYTYSTAALKETDTTIEIDYNGQKAYVEISVSPAPVLDSITVANAQGKTAEYTVGDVISKDDIVVTAHYTQGKPDAVVTNYTISKTTALALGDTSVTISYTEGGIEKTAAYSFTVTKPTEPQIDVSNVDSYSIDAASLGLGSYADGANTDLAWTMLCKGNSDTLQGNSSKSSELHNKIAFSKNITYIKFNIGYGAGEAATGSVRFGSSVTPTGNDTSYGANTDLSLVTVGSFNVSAPAGCNYFSVVWTKGASYFSSIEIHFEEMGEQEQVAVQSVSLNKTSTSINVGSNETLVATVAPSNANDKSVNWSSSDSTIATVDSTGKVTGIAQGTATITVTTTDGEKTATCSVTVVSSGAITSSPIDLGGSATVVFNGTSYSKSIKAGTGSAAGSTTISVPSGAKKLTFYAAGWNKETVKISVSGGGISKTLSLTSDAGVSGNGPTYTVGSTNEASFKFEIDVSSLSGATTLTISATSGKRFVVWNASYTK